jgi:hypothetical protein
MTLFALAIIALAAHFVVFLRDALVAVSYPYELFDAEGIVWQQAMLIPDGRMYSDINRYPFIVFHYPPVYHLAVRAVAAFGVDPLAAGRGISLAAALMTGALAASLAFRVTRQQAGRLPSLAGAATAGPGFFCFFPVIMCAPLMRVDMLAIGLSFLGIWCATRASGAARWLTAAMILFVLAAFTKQTCIIAPLATLAVMALVNPRQALRLFGFGLLLGGAGLLIMTWATDGGFLRHIVLYNVNRFSIRTAMLAIIGQAPHIIFVLLAMVSVVVGWKQIMVAGRWTSLASVRRNLCVSPTARLMAILTLYLALSTCTLVTLGKSGGGLNYFIEWMAILSVLIGILVAMTVKNQSVTERYRPAVAFGVLLPLALLVQVLRLPASREFAWPDPAQIRQLDDLVVRIRDTDRPVLSDDMVLLMKAGKQVPWEPAIFTELASKGRWDERQIISLIDAHYFAFVITHEHRGTPSYGNLYTPGVLRAIEAAYPRTEEHAERTLHLPPN